MKFLKSIILGISTVALYTLSYVLYYRINLGIDRCASSCPGFDAAWFFGTLLIPLSILWFTIYFRPLRNKNVNKIIHILLIVLKSLFIIVLLGILFLIIFVGYSRYSISICNTMCNVAIIPHPLSKWLFLLGSVSLMLLVYFFNKEYKEISTES